MTVRLTPYLMMNGNAKEAIQFYEQTIGAEVFEIVTYREMPKMPITFTDDLKNLVAHAKLQVGETEIMFSDTPGGSPIQKGNQITICISTNDVEKFIRIAPVS
jgi:PhnB protein